MTHIARAAALVGSVVAALALTSTASAQNLIHNGGFETPINSATDWSTFGNAYQVLNGTGAPPYAGIGDAKLFGTFPGTSGFYQDFAASVGESFNGVAYGYNWSSDPMQANNDGFLRITFFNSSNSEIGGAGMNSADIDVNTPANTWEELTISNVVAPAGTAYGAVYLLFTQPGTNGGSAWFDNVSVTPAPEPITMFGLGAGVVALIARRRRRA